MTLPPGPWREQETGSAIVDANGVIVAEVWTATPRTEAEDDEIARAIAALPELVDALRSIASETPADGHGSNWPCSCPCTQCTAIDALKALSP